MTAEKAVADAILGEVARRQWEIFRRVKEGNLDPDWVLNELQSLIEGGDWLERILAKEERYHRDFFSQEFDLASFREALEKYGQGKIAVWQELGLEPHFLPEVAITQDTKFKGWKVKPENWYYEKVTGGKMLRQRPDGDLIPDEDAFKLKGVTVLVDTRLKPAVYDEGKQMWEDDNLLGSIVERLRKEGKIEKHDYGLQSSRFGVSADEWEKQVRPALAELLGLKVSQVRLERAIEMNVIPQLYPEMPRANDGQTNTWVWLEEYFGGRERRLVGGRSCYGGLADVRCDWSDFRWSFRSFRPLAVL